MVTRITLIAIILTAAYAGTSAAQDVPKLRALSPSSLALTANDAGAVEAWQTAQPRRDSRLNGFLIGLAAGAVPGLWLGMGMRSWCDNESGAECSVWVPIVAVPLALAGGGIGFAIDGAIGQSMNVGRPRPNPGVRISLRF